MLIPDLTTGVRVDSNEMELYRSREGMEHGLWATVSSGHETSLAYHSFQRDMEAWSLGMSGGHNL